jgi:hypothetical protein
MGAYAKFIDFVFEIVYLTETFVSVDQVFAWQLADQLLHANKDVESCYFAAHTIRRKVG